MGGMKMIQWIIIIGVAAFVISRFIPVKGITHSSPQEAKKMFRNKNIQFIDVRTPGEYKSNHHKPFKNIPLSELVNRLKELDKEKEVVVICQSGMRSVKASKMLKKHGFSKITNVRGGMSSWV